MRCLQEDEEDDEGEDDIEETEDEAEERMRNDFIETFDIELAKLGVIIYREFFFNT